MSYMEIISSLRKDVVRIKTQGLTQSELISNYCGQIETSDACETMRKVAAEETRLNVGQGRYGLVLYEAAPEDAINKLGPIGKFISWRRSKQINEFSQKKAELNYRREEVYKEIEYLEKEDTKLVEQGKQQTSKTGKLRMASRIASLRRSINSLFKLSKFVSDQINVLDTHINNLTISLQCEIIKLPSQKELTNKIVEKEELFEGLDETLAVANTDNYQPEISDDEVSIMAEFDEPEPPHELLSLEDEEVQKIVQTIKETSEKSDKEIAEFTDNLDKSVKERKDRYDTRYGVKEPEVIE